MFDLGVPNRSLAHGFDTQFGVLYVIPQYFITRERRKHTRRCAKLRFGTPNKITPGKCLDKARLGLHNAPSTAHRDFLTL